MRVDRYLAPEQQGHAACGAALLKDALGIFYALGILRQKEHGDAVVAFFRQDLAAFLSLFTEEAMRNLEQDARAVTGVALQPDAASMLKVDKHRECIVQNLVAFVAIDVCQRADAAGVVLKFRSPKRLHMGTSLRGVFGIRSVHRVCSIDVSFLNRSAEHAMGGFFPFVCALVARTFRNTHATNSAQSAKVSSARDAVAMPRCDRKERVMSTERFRHARSSPGRHEALAARDVYKLDCYHRGRSPGPGRGERRRPCHEGVGPTQRGHALCPLVPAALRHHVREARQLPGTQPRWYGDYQIYRQSSDQGRAGRLELPQRRPARHPPEGPRLRRTPPAPLYQGRGCCASPPPSVPTPARRWTRRRPFCAP